jgi:REP element-mobilizing transposase RayT
MPATYDPEQHRRRSFRLSGYDYAQDGIYFVTICVRDRACALGSVRDGEMHLNEQGRLVARCWSALPDHFPTVLLDTFVIMPNHLHGLLCLTGPVSVISENQDTALRPTLAVVVGSIKSAASRAINAHCGTSGTVWQRGYYEHIVRSGRSMDRLRRYISENPARWAQDQFHPDTPPPR